MASSDTGASAAPSVNEGGDEPEDDDAGGDADDDDEREDGDGDADGAVSELTRAMRMGESGDRPLRARGSVGGD